MFRSGPGPLPGSKGRSAVLRGSRRMPPWQAGMLMGDAGTTEGLYLGDLTQGLEETEVVGGS